MDLTFQVPMQYCSLQHQTILPSPNTYTTGCYFCFGSASSFLLELFLCSSPVAYQTPTDLEGFIFQCRNFLPFHAVHVVLKPRTLKWFAFLFSNGPCSVRTLHHDPAVLVAPPGMAHSFSELDKAVVHVISLVSFL